MSVQNTFSVKINGINLTRYAVLPLKKANMLDERLDEAYISLRHVRIDKFSPATRVEITERNAVLYGTNTISNESNTTHYIVVNDDAVESPAGSGLYDHDIYIIELTKLLELVVTESLTFTNALGQLYDLSEIAAYAVNGLGQEHVNVSEYANSFKSLCVAGVSPSLVPPYELAEIYYDADFAKLVGPVIAYSVSITTNGDEVLHGELHMPTEIGSGDPNLYFEGTAGGYSIRTDPDNTVPPTITPAIESAWNSLLSHFIPREGRTYTVRYDLFCLGETGIMPTIPSFLVTIEYNTAAVSNYYPLKRLTCSDVLKRLLVLAEPLLYGEEPRFSLNAEQADRFDKIYAPQFSMTRQTLRESLKEVGKVLHGEPRLDVTGQGKYEISYDLYGGTKQSFVGRHANIRRATSYQLEQFCTVIDSSASNMVNQTDWAAGVIVEPDAYYYKTPRTETQYVRITDANMLISTDRPIYQLAKEGGLRVLVPNGRYVTPIDLTPYVYESTIYNSQMSSYSEAYPYSKAYALYFKQGENSIRGLNFKVENAVDTSVFSDYAIVNIIKRACAARNIDWTPPEGQEYAELLFQVTYVPYFDVRVAQSKPYYKEFDGQYALVYNQSANTIESRYYGENLKGTVARLGNPEKVITYTLSRLSQIPKAGELYDEDYYISAVTTEMYPTYFKCMVALSRDFNRWSQFVGVSSEKRYYEVSERQTYDRSTLYHEYITVGDEEASDSSLIQSDFMSAVADTFTQTGDYRPLTRVVAWGGTYSEPISTEVNGEVTSPLPCVQLPVVSVALGNSMCFIWNYRDNYSAGPVSQYQTAGEVSGYCQQDYQYTDYYGRMYYYNFGVYSPGPTSVNASNELMIKEGLELPEGNFPSEPSTYLATTVPYIYRKDSREIPQFNVQVEFVTNRKDIIIGSALASSCGLIRGSDSTLAAKLYVLDERVGKFTTRLSAQPDFADVALPEPVDISITTAPGNRFYITSAAFNKSGKAWAILTEQTETTETVEDEEGNVTQQTMYNGGEVLLACNGDFSVGDDIGQIWFCPSREPHKTFFLVAFLERSVALDPPSPNSVELYKAVFSDVTLSNMPPSPTATPLYNVEMSDVSRVGEACSPTGENFYTLEFLDSSLIKTATAPSDENMYKISFETSLSAFIADPKTPTPKNNL